MNPPYNGTIFIAGNIITADDPTAFVSITDAGHGERVMFDRRLNTFKKFDAYLFDAKFDDKLAAQIQVNPEFGSQEAARLEAQKYGPAIGRLPTALRASVESVWIHRGLNPFGGGNASLLIHTEQAEQYQKDGILEEALVHEAAHTSLEGHANAEGWTLAQKDDDAFISTYARDNPVREDVAESFLPYLALRFHPNRISQTDTTKILNTIPKRIAYFDAQGFAIHPVAPAPPLLKLVKASASSGLAEPYNGRPQTAERLIEGPHDGAWFWNSDDRGKDPTPWFSVMLEKPSVVEWLYIRWKAKYGSVGARAMRYRVLSSLDGTSWTETGVDQSQVPGLSPEFAIEVLPGWAAPTRYIKVEMSESSYGKDGYFSCRYVLVTGRPV